MSGGFEYFQAEGGAGVAARGPTLEAAFAQAALGAFARIANLSAVKEREVREVRAHGSSLTALLVNWVNECLYLHEVEGFLARRVEFAAFEARPRPGAEPLRLHGFLHGEQVDPVRHQPLAPVKTARPEQASVQIFSEGFEARVVLEI